MTLVYRDSDLEDLISPQLAIDALEAVFRLEANHCTTVPSRLNASAPGGWLRLMPAVIDSDGQSAMGFKAMNLRHGNGVRYVTLLYDVATGELAAIMDAARLTRVRTAAVTAIACRRAGPSRVVELGLFGSGNEARSHAYLFSAVFPDLKRIVLFSPNEDHRGRLAQDVSRDLGIRVDAVGEPAAAAKMPVVVLATKSSKVVVQSDWFEAGTFVLSIGSTRLDLRELDEATFGRARTCIADSPEQVVLESGDVQAALNAGHLQTGQILALADLVAGKTDADWPPEDILVFKSVGTALQDLAVSEAVHKACIDAGRGVRLDDFPIPH